MRGFLKPMPIKLRAISSCSSDELLLLLPPLLPAANELLLLLPPPPADELLLAVGRAIVLARAKLAEESEEILDECGF